MALGLQRKFFGRTVAVNNDLVYLNFYRLTAALRRDEESANLNRCSRGNALEYVFGRLLKVDYTLQIGPCRPVV
jgi:hypothetical protein